MSLTLFCRLLRITINFRSVQDSYSQTKRIIKMRNVVTNTMAQQMDKGSLRVDTTVFQHLNNSSIIQTDRDDQ